MLIVPHKQIQLGLEIDTRKLLLSLLESKRIPLIHLTKHWHQYRKSFAIKEDSSLLGKLSEVYFSIVYVETENSS